MSINIVWKKVPEEKFSEHYEISNDGQVRRASLVPHGKSTFVGKILKKHIRGKNNKYHYVLLFNKGFSKHFYVHRLVAKAFISNPNQVGYVNHINGDKLDNRLENLEWVTCKQNIQHAISFGSFKQHNNLSIKKLKKEDIYYIRNTFKKSCKKNGIAAIARRLKVSPNCVSDVVKNITWKHVLPLFL